MEEILSTFQDKKEAIAELMKRDREKFAQLMVDVIKPGHLTEDYVSLMLKVRKLKPGDALVKRAWKGIQVRTLVPGTEQLATQPSISDRVNISLEGAVASVAVNLWDLTSGEIGTPAEIRAEMEASLRDYFVGKVFRSLSTVWSPFNTPDNYLALSTPITPTALENAIDRINDVTPGAKVVIGTKKAMAPVTKFGAFVGYGSLVGHSPDLINEVHRKGFLGKYYGVDLVAVEQVRSDPEGNVRLIPDDIILVIGKEAGEFILYGDPQVKQWDDMRFTPPYWRLEIYQQFGLVIDTAEGVFVIRVAS